MFIRNPHILKIDITALSWWDNNGKRLFFSDGKASLSSITYRVVYKLSRYRVWGCNCYLTTLYQIFVGFPRSSHQVRRFSTILLYITIPRMLDHLCIELLNLPSRCLWNSSTIGSFCIHLLHGLTYLTSDFSRSPSQFLLSFPSPPACTPLSSSSLLS